MAQTLAHKINYQSWHRGTRELDLILGRFVDAHLTSMNEDEIHVFNELISHDDPDIYHWVVNAFWKAPGNVRPMVHKIREFYNLTSETMMFEITTENYPVILDIRYASTNNFTGHVVYKKPLCFLHEAARGPFEKTIQLADALGYKLKIFDAFRPSQAQAELWRHCPDPMYVTPPERGSPHSRGVAIDLTLLDSNGVELDMGTGFDDFTEQSHHGAILPPQQMQNRYTLMGIMMSAGWDFYKNEWWHYQLFNAREYPVLENHMGIMDL